MFQRPMCPIGWLWKKQRKPGHQARWTQRPGLNRSLVDDVRQKHSIAYRFSGATNYILILAFMALRLVFPENGIAQSPEPASTDSVTYSRDVRPILSKHCFACHGPDENKRESGLRLDTNAEDGIDFDDLLQRINSDDDSYVMPPPSANKPLDKKDISRLERWIAEGAKHERHWAFVHPKKSIVPTEVHPVDHFVDQKLNQNELRRSPPETPAKLIRRLYLDLIGLPPTIEQAEAFINDPTQENYAHIVDQLLDSPRYGERWARRWLDLARYADTNGYEKDRDRSIWPYRDWVIRSINDDMPFDQFTIEQLAGDMLPNPTDDQRIATGFHRNTMLNEEGGIDPLEYRFYAMVDRVGTTGTTWLGLTTACAQCHTHKYDPITHENYFGMMAYLNNADEPDFFVTTETTQARQLKKRQEAEQLLKELTTHWPSSTQDKKVPTFDEAFDDWLANQKSAIATWLPITPQKMLSNLPVLNVEEDSVIFVTGDTTKHDTFTLSFSGLETPVTALRLEALPDDRLPNKGPGMTYYEGIKGDFFLAEINVSLKGQAQPWGRATHSFAKNQFGANPVSAQLATDGDFQTGWSIANRTGERHVAVFNFATAIPAGIPFEVKMEFGRHFASPLGKFRISVCNEPASVTATAVPAPLLKQVTDPDAATNEGLRQAFAMQAKPLEAQANRIRRLQTSSVGITTMVMRERPSGQNRETRLHHRGEFTNPRQIVSPHLPDALWDHQKTPPRDRLEFARWLVSPENPLTARVIANRQWAAFFGTGLVATVDDFGMQGESPSHPQLLDYLAVDFIKKKWSRKALHRLIVTSQTYQQSSAMPNSDNPSQADRLLARFPRKRLEAELIRDASLVAAGLLDERMFGEPVRPIQPAGAAANYSRSKWQPSPGSDRYRRSVYTYQKRTAPFAMFATFDGGSGESCLARRDTSNTPLQALTLLNDPMFVDISNAFGKRMENVEGGSRDKIIFGFRSLLTRAPSTEELEMLTEFLEQHKNWPAVARVLLCLDESITKN